MFSENYVKVSERVYEVKKWGKKYVKIDIPDLSKITQEYYEVFFENLDFHSYAYLGEKSEIINEKGTIFVPWENFNRMDYRSFLKKIKKPRYFEKISDVERNLRAKFEDLVLEINKMNFKSEMKYELLKELIQTSSLYGSIPMEPYLRPIYVKGRLSRRCKNSSTLQTDINLMLSPEDARNWIEEMNLELLSLAEIKKEGKTPDYQKFIDDFGYIGSCDLRPNSKFENKINLERQVREIVKNRSFDYRSDKKEYYRNRMATISSRNAMIKRVYEISQDETLFGLMKHMGLALAHDDRQRRMRTKTFKIFREVVLSLGMDLQKTSLDGLRRQL